MAGRPTKFKESFVQDAVQICEMGATIPELAESLGVSRRSIYQWASKYPAFAHALKVGKAPADDRVERSMFQKAVGFTTTETKRKYAVTQGKDGKDVRTLVSEEIHDKSYAPDVTAGIFWLKNRRPELWMDRKSITGDLDINIGDGISDRELKQRVLGLLLKQNAEASLH